MIYLGGYASQGGQAIGMAAFGEGVLAVASVAGRRDDPTVLAVAPGGRTLYAVHELADGLVSAFAIGGDGTLRLLGTQGSGADGGLGAVAHVVEHPKPYAHMMTTDPTGRWVLAVHYGVGAVFTYHIDLESGRLRPRRQAHLHSGAALGIWPSIRRERSSMWSTRRTRR